MKIDRSAVSYLLFFIVKAHYRLGGNAFTAARFAYYPKYLAVSNFNGNSVYCCYRSPYRMKHCFQIFYFQKSTVCHKITPPLVGSCVHNITKSVTEKIYSKYKKYHY